MGKNTGNRDLYFDKHIRNTPTAEAYIQALRDSPYRTHRRVAIELQSQYEGMVEASQGINEDISEEVLDEDTK